MVEPSDISKEVEEVVSEADLEKAKHRDKQRIRRNQALRLRVAGLTYEQIGERLGISSVGAQKLITRTLERAENRNVEQDRALENERLDVAQSVIWSRVLEGDIKAIDAYLRISNQRVKINALATPTQIDLNIGVRTEMEQALANLERMVNLRGPVVDVQQVGGNGEGDDDIMDAEFSDVDEDNLDGDIR